MEKEMDIITKESTHFEKSINKHNRFIRSKYTLTPFQQKFIYTLINIVQTSTRHLYRKILTHNINVSNCENSEILEYKFNNIAYDEELSTTKNVSVILSQNKDKHGQLVDEWRINIDFSIDDYYTCFNEVNKQRRMSKKQFRELIEKTRRSDVYIINENNESYVQTSWYKIHGKLKNIEFYEKVTLELDVDIANFIMARANFTKLNMISLQSLSGFYAMRIYEIVKEWCKFSNERVYQLDQLKKMLDLQERKGYNNFSNFNKLLRKSVDEINKSTELNLDYVPHDTKGKKITAIRFFLKDEPTENLITIEDTVVIQSFMNKITEIISLKITKLKHEDFYKSFRKYDFDIKYRQTLLNVVQATIEYFNSKNSEKGFKPAKSINIHMYSFFKKMLEDSLKNSNYIDNIESQIEEVSYSNVTNTTQNEEQNKDEECLHAKTITNENTLKNEKISEIDMIKLVLYEQLSATLTEVQFNTWFANIIPNIYKENNLVYFPCPNTFTKDIIEKRYRDSLTEILANSNYSTKVEFVVVN